MSICAFDTCDRLCAQAMLMYKEKRPSHNKDKPCASEWWLCKRQEAAYMPGDKANTNIA